MPPSEPVSSAAVITHGRVETIGDGLERLHAVAEHNDVTLLLPKEEREKHSFRPPTTTLRKPTS